MRAAEQSQERTCFQTNRGYQDDIDLKTDVAIVYGIDPGIGARIATWREQGYITHLMTGASNTEIADSLFVSEHTIKSHLYNVFKKLNVKNRLQAVSWAKEYL